MNIIKTSSNQCNKILANYLGDAIARWIRFILAYYPVVPGLNPKHTVYAFIYSNFVLYLSLYWEKDENKQKKAGFGPYFFKKNI